MRTSFPTREKAVSSLPEGDQDRLAQILDDYLTAAERGSPIDPEDLLGSHPDDADYLRPYLRGLQQFHAAAAHESASGISLVTSSLRAADVIGDYRITGEIGRGGMGVVYEATQISLQRHVALKVLHSSASQNEKHIQRFQNEAHAAATAEHPNIVPVHAIGNENGVHYYAMQLIEGHSLARLLTDQRTNVAPSPFGTTVSTQQRTTLRKLNSQKPAPLPSDGSTATTSQPMKSSNQARSDIRELARLGIQAADALHAAHEFGVVHRDVKPSNLLVDDQGKLWVTDFGLALCRDNQGLTQTGELLGTMRYMSPEQARGHGEMIDHRTDVYSLGVTLYELATLHHPAGDASDLELLANRDRLLQKPLRHWRSDIPLDFQTIVMKAISEVPDERYRTAHEFAQDLQRFLNGHPIVASRPSIRNRAGKWAKRHRGLVCSIAAILVVAFVGQTVNSFMLSKSNAEKDRALAAAKENLQQAHTVLDRFGTRLVDQLAAIPGAEGVRYQLLEDSLSLYEQFESQAAGQHVLTEDLARAYGKIGQLSEKLGNREKALQKHRAAAQLWQSRLDEEPGSSEAKRQLALSQNNIGLLFAEQGRFDQSLGELLKSSELQRELLAEQPKIVGVSAELATTLNNLGHAHHQLGQTDAAIDQFRAAIALGESLTAVSKENERALRGLAASYNNLGSILTETNYDRASAAFRRAVEIQRRLVKTQPINRLYQGDLARTYNNLGAMFADVKNWKSAETVYINAVRLQENLVASSPLAMSYRRDLAISFNNLGMALSQQLQRTNAESALKSALELQQMIVTALPKDGKALSHLGGVWNNLGLLYQQRHKFAKAESAFSEAIRCQQQAFDDAPLSPGRREFLSNHYANYASCLRKQEKTSAAEQVEQKRSTVLATSK